VGKGEQNWYALRSEWREVPADFDESKVQRTDPASVDMNAVYGHLFKSTGKFKIPLSVAISSLTQIWAENP
jgi:hypothetical protein